MSLLQNRHCVLCRSLAVVSCEERPGWYTVRCGRCGDYHVSEQASAELRRLHELAAATEQRRQVSLLARLYSDRGSPMRLSFETIKHLVRLQGLAVPTPTRDKKSA